MKKYLGNAAVKGVIASAMTALLVVTAPVNVTAADAAAVIEFTDITDAAQENILDKDTVENKIEEALKDTDLTKEQKDLLKDLGGDISQVDTTQDSYDVVDDVKDIIHNDVTNAVTNEKNDAAAAADAAEEISDTAGNAASQVKQGETVTDTLLKDDQDIVKEVKGNTVISTDENGNETKLVNGITEEGKIILNVEDSDGNRMNLPDYTIYQAKDLSKNLDDMVDQASKEVTDSAKRYDEAKAKYEEILKQYEALVNNNITSNLDALELKLANAKNELAEADFNLNEAQKALDTAASLKEQFENDIANSGNTSSSDDSGSTGSDSTASAATTAAAFTVAIDDGATPLADGITDAASSDLATLDDEATALADSVPKTGDTANAAIPFGFAAFAAFAGAFVTRMRRRNN